MNIIENFLAAERLGKFFETSGRTSAKAGKNRATKVLRNLLRTLEFGAKMVVQQYPKILKQLCQYFQLQFFLSYW